MTSLPKTTSSAAYAAADAYCGLRDQVLALQPMPAAMGGVTAVLAEFGMDAVATVAVIADGTTSLYLSSGGGCIGCGQHKLVAVCALKLLGAAEQAQQLMTLATTCPLPSPKHVRFYVVSANGVMTVELPESQLATLTDAFSPLYRLAQNVIGAIRMVTPKPATTPPSA